MRVLTVNTGSSSLKLALYEATAGSEPAALGAWPARGLATPEAFTAALRQALDRIPVPEAVGHRLVIGGAAWGEPRRIDAGVLEEIRVQVPAAPDHLPQALAAIDLTREHYPGVAQIGCSDCAFHRTLPAVARAVPLPGWALDLGGGSRIERYGYHGLSCESVLAALRAEDAAAARRRLVIAHLGSGASLTAVREGQSVETTMGFTPLGGVPMSTRSGDLDPGVLVAVLRQNRLAPGDLNRMLNHSSGLLAVAGTTGDMAELLRLAPTQPAAAQAVELFVYQVRKALGGLAAVLGGVDVLIFTGGIGENAAEIRARIVDGMEWLGMAVRVIPADEERMIARHAVAALAG